MMTDEQKRKRKIAKIAERFKALQTSTYLNEVAKEFQRLVRVRAADENGICECVTCGSKLRWNVGWQMQSGHFVSGRSNSVLFDDRNCHPQCSSCNVFSSGNQEKFTTYMIERYGQNVIDELIANRQLTVTIDREQAAEMLQEYREQIAIEKRRIA